MKQQSVTQMQKDVRVILEEAVNAAPLEGVTDVGTISINEVIKGVLTKAVTAVANVAPMELFSTPQYRRYAVTTSGVFVRCTDVNTNITAQTIEFDYEAENPNNVTVELVSGLEGTITKTATTVSVALEASSVMDGIIRFTVGSSSEPAAEVNVHRNPLNTTTTYVYQDATNAAFKFSGYNGSYLNKPADYLRFFYVQGDSWMRPVTALTPLSSPFTSIARSDVNMSVGNEDKPLAVDSFVKGKGAVEIYPSPDFADFVYVERPVISGDNINCDDGIYQAAVLYAAYLVAMIKGYNNAEGYKNAALEAITQPNLPTNATAGAPVAQG